MIMIDVLTKEQRTRQWEIEPMNTSQKEKKNFKIN